MTLFVHICDERDAKAIRRSGLRTAGIFAMPVIDDFLATHQWLRELKRKGHRTSVGIYIRIPDDEAVFAGHFRGPHVTISAAKAAATFRRERMLGFEVIIPRAIARSEIVKVRRLPQCLGWRYFPEAKGKRPCGCDFCLKGQIKGQRIRQRYEREGL